MKRFCLVSLPIVFGVLMLGFLPAVRDSKVATAAEISKEWTFDATALKANGIVKAASQSNGDKLHWQQITAQFDDMAYPEAFARVLKFYADKCGTDFKYDPKTMVLGRKGERKGGRSIFTDVRNEPHETSFVFDSGVYSVGGIIRPSEEKNSVEAILTIAVR